LPEIKQLSQEINVIKTRVKQDSKSNETQINKFNKFVPCMNNGFYVNSRTALNMGHHIDPAVPAYIYIHTGVLISP